jgi:hypothetical protein
MLGLDRSGKPHADEERIVFIVCQRTNAIILPHLKRIDDRLLRRTWWHMRRLEAIPAILSAVFDELDQLSSSSSETIRHL